MRDIGQQSQYRRTDLTGVDDKLSLVAAVGIMTSKATCFDYPSPNLHFEANTLRLRCCLPGGDISGSHMDPRGARWCTFSLRNPI